MRKLAVGLAIMLAAISRTAWAQCEIPVEIRQILDKPVMQQKAVETQADKDARTAAIQEALAMHPDNYFLLWTQSRSFTDPDERLRWARDLHKQHADKPVYALIEAEALLGIDTPEAIRRIEALKTAHPDMQLHLALANAVRSGKFKDQTKVQKELDAYIRLCSESISLDGLFLSLIRQNGSQDQVAWTAAALRKRLETDPNETRTALWETLWSLEFKWRPPAEHADVRKKIAEDLMKLEKSPNRQKTTLMTVLRSGYESLGDQAAVERLNDEILKSHPESDEAKQIVQQRWREKNPMPKPDDKAAMEAYKQASLAAAKEWRQSCPNDSMFLWTIFNNLSQSPDTTSEQIASASDEFMRTYRKDPYWSSSPPIEFGIAGAYVKHKIRLDQVPSLVKESYRDTVNRYKGNLTDDRLDDQTRGMMRDSLDSMHLQAAHILLDCYAATKQPEKVKEVLAEMASIDTSKPYMKADMLSLQAQAAEIEGRKLDALMLYRTAMETRGANPSRSDVKDELSGNLQRLWKEMGGTQEGFGLLMEKKKITESTENRWERSKNPLPSFSLKDLNGKPWSLAKLGGKVLLINVWATWCGPCVAEHPEFQKLYDNLKERSDIAVLSFNVDEDLGKVAPYMAKHNYTFPVIPAADVVNAVKPNLAIPQNWLVNPEGKLEWEQIGYGPDPKWQDMIIAKLEELLKQKR